MDFDIDPPGALWGYRVRFHDDGRGMASTSIGEHTLDKLASLNEPLLSEFNFSPTDFILQALQMVKAD